MAMNEEANNIPQFHMGDRLRKALAVSGVSVEDIAAEIGVTPNTAGNYMALRTNPKRSVVAQWALKTGISFDWLWTGLGHSESDPTDPSEQVSKSSPCMTDNVTSLHTRRSAKQQAA